MKRTNESSLQHLNTVIDSLEHLRRGQQAGGVASGKVETQYDLTFYYRSQQQHEELTRSVLARLWGRENVSSLAPAVAIVVGVSYLHGRPCPEASH